MTKLTTRIRERIVHDLMQHRFNEDAQKLVADRAVFALDVYDAVYSGAEQKRMAGLPTGWLQESTRIGVQFGGSRGYTQLEFSGDVYGTVRSVMMKKADDVRRRVQHTHESGCAMAFDADHPLSEAYDALAAREKSLCEAIDTAKRQSEAAISNATTAKRLIELWPEIEPFVEKHMDVPKALPILPTSQLNALLDLPVSEAA